MTEPQNAKPPRGEAHTEVDMWSRLKALLRDATERQESFAIDLPPGTSSQDVADEAFTALLRGESLNDAVYELSTKLRLGHDEAVSALHRVLAGVAAARASAPESLPAVGLDPIGWASYEAARRNHEGAKRIMG